MFHTWILKASCIFISHVTFADGSYIWSLKIFDKFIRILLKLKFENVLLAYNVMLTMCGVMQMENVFPGKTVTPGRPLSISSKSSAKTVDQMLCKCVST
jgi:hypothetical protein